MKPAINIGDRVFLKRVPEISFLVLYTEDDYAICLDKNNVSQKLPLSIIEKQETVTTTTGKTGS